MDQSTIDDGRKGVSRHSERSEAVAPRPSAIHERSITEYGEAGSS